MKIFNNPALLIKELKHLRKEGASSIGFVPTMGALHKGHISLIEKSISENDITVCSIFINPIQFNNEEDFNKYPKLYDEDLAKLKSACCDVVFIPEVSDMYPNQPLTKIDFGIIESVLEGAFRPGHFNGVGIVVSKLFNIVHPDRAYFGQKDLQQVQVVKQLVRDLSFQTEIVTCPTFRSKEGLALSSRNKRLSDKGLVNALVLYKTLKTCAKALQTTLKVDFAKEVATKILIENKKFVTPEYLEIVRLSDLKEVTTVQEGDEVAICIAAFVEDIRLIDNLIIKI